MTKTSNLDHNLKQLNASEPKQGSSVAVAYDQVSADSSMPTSSSQTKPTDQASIQRILKMLRREIALNSTQDQIEKDLKDIDVSGITDLEFIHLEQEQLASHLELAHYQQQNVASFADNMKVHTSTTIEADTTEHHIKPHSDESLIAMVQETFAQVEQAKTEIAIMQELNAQAKSDSIVQAQATPTANSTADLTAHISAKFMAEHPQTGFNEQDQYISITYGGHNVHEDTHDQYLTSPSLLKMQVDPPKYDVQTNLFVLPPTQAIETQQNEHSTVCPHHKDLSKIAFSSILESAQKHNFDPNQSLANTQDFSFTYKLPIFAYSSMTEILCSKHSLIITNRDNFNNLVPPIQAGTVYEVVLTKDAIKPEDAQLYLEQFAKASEIDFNLSQDVEQIICSSYKLHEVFKEHFVPWFSYPKHTGSALFADEPDLAITHEVHKTLNYVIHHHEKFKHDNQPELLTCVGRWCFDREDGGFYIDKGGAKLFGLKVGQARLTLAELYQVFDKEHVDSIIKSQNDSTTGNIVARRLLLISGPYAGKVLIAQGAVVIRDPITNQALFSSGILCYEYCPHADFLYREILGDGMYIWDLEHDRIIVSPSYLLMLGYTRAEFPTQTKEFARMLVHPDDDDAIRIQHMIVRSPAYGNSFESCVRLKHKSGRYIWTLGRGVVLERNNKGVATKIIGSQTDIDLVHKSFENIGELMFTDSLTELHNRSYLTQNAIRFDSKKVSPMSIIFVDVSGLKLTNDILGHNFGDYLILKCVIGMLQALQNVLGHFHLLDDFKNQMSETIDHLTHKAFAQIFQNKDLLVKAEEVASKNNKEYQSNMKLHAPSTSNFDGIDSPHSQVIDLKPEDIDTLIQQTMKPEIVRLAGDELLLLFPSCSLELAQQLEQEILFTARKMNSIDKLSFPIEQRPVPLCFGIGTATIGELGENDSFNQALERADMRMMQHKESYHQEHHQMLQDYFEQRLKRKVSMRDSRRSEILSESERQKLRTQRLSAAQSKAEATREELVTLPQVSMLKRTNQES